MTTPRVYEPPKLARKPVELVCLSFDSGIASRYRDRVRTHRSQIPEGFNGNDAQQVEHYRRWPDLYEAGK